MLKAGCGRNRWGALLLLVCVVLFAYIGSYFILSALGGYIFTQSGKYRYSFWLSMNDLVQWQPKYGFAQPFRDLDGKDTFRASPLGCLYFPLILSDQKYVHKTVGPFAPKQLGHSDSFERADKLKPILVILGSLCVLASGFLLFVFFKLRLKERRIEDVSA